MREGIPLVGHAQGEAVLLVRRGEQVFATGASCTHYGGETRGSIAARAFAAFYVHQGRVAALVTLGRDLLGLE